MSKRQVDVALKVSAGLTSKQIGRLLLVSYQTVAKHRQAIFKLLGVHSVAELALGIAAAGLGDTLSEL
ncbi:helix-turn-helix transcriptional regulator [Massilia sp. CCM 8734]|uniref:response regulator transcription factor n=1 Tax=Massilia sp. CCM 8734 TaxID=2609283 RepID=UPI0014243D0D|nr:helix-turn-helix transcriptional regulator [Massilia sp. CCM 8734]NHZ98501.1 DNA-binding response regulator [Massilia sp. CCM 8734]